MTNRIVLGVVVVAVTFYVAMLTIMGVAFITGGGLGIVLGIGTLALMATSVWSVARELRFGVESTRLARMIVEQDGVPLDTVPRDEHGRVDAAAAQIEWQRRKALVDAAPDDWRAWFLLGIAYDNARDRRQARAAIRRAIGLQRGRGGAAA